LWIPIYVWEGWLKATTAIASVATAFYLMSLVPQLIKVPSPKALQREVLAHQQTIAALKIAQAALATRVGETESELQNSFEKQQLSNSLLRTVVESAPGPIYAKDRQGRLLLANNGALELIGNHPTYPCLCLERGYRQEARRPARTGQRGLLLRSGRRRRSGEQDHRGSR
jgi:PAS domain-containing protein